jgi:hypothetical protein
MKDIERKLLELRKQQPDIGVATISLNRLPIFQPTLRPKYQEKTFESRHGRINIRGRLGQNHKSLLETILYLRKLYDLDKEKMCLSVLYNEYEVKKYLTQGSTTYSHEWYKKLLMDMMHASFSVEEGKRASSRTLIKDKKPSDNYYCKAKSNLPDLKGEKISYMILEFGELASYLISQELKFTYDPKPIISLRNGISQALVRFLMTFTKHPSAGYHLQPLIEHLEGQMTNKRWWKIREYLKEDAERLENIGIVIDFKKDRLFVIKNLF